MSNRTEFSVRMNSSEPTPELDHKSDEKRLFDRVMGEPLTRGDRDMSVKVPFCRGLLEHLKLTLTNETFQVYILNYYLHIEQKMRSEKGRPTDFWPVS